MIGVMCEGMKVIRCWCVTCEDDGHMMMASVFFGVDDNVWFVLV